jgi:hypothetical protein
MLGTASSLILLPVVTRQKPVTNARLRLAMRTLIASCLILVPGFGTAHHSPANFNLNVTDFAVTGTIASVSFRNPHSVIQLLVESDDGNSTEWYVEFSSVNLLLRRGWDLESIEAGDTVTCIGNPSQNGAAEMYMWTIRLSDGTEFGR